MSTEITTHPGKLFGAARCSRQNGYIPVKPLAMLSFQIYATRIYM